MSSVNGTSADAGNVSLTEHDLRHVTVRRSMAFRTAYEDEVCEGKWKLVTSRRSCMPDDMDETENGKSFATLYKHVTIRKNGLAEKVVDYHMKDKKVPEQPEPVKKPQQTGQKKTKQQEKNVVASKGPVASKK